MDDPIADGMNAVGKLLNTEPVRNLLAPVTKEVGLVLGSIGSLVRFYCEDNLQKVFTKWAQQRNGKPLEPSEFIKVIPLLQAASLVSDEELQECWAALLESSVSEPENCVPSFSQTLTLLTPDGARYLNRLHLRIAGEVNEPSHSGTYHRLGNFDEMVGIYNSQGDNGGLSRVHLLLHDLVRLGLIWREREDDTYPMPIIGNHAINVSGFQMVYYFSDFGLRFVQALTP